ncbi:AAA family ATPase [Erysipelothrix anatis]|uniref:AAA family ATPase n=1 Tax=Erysipelothrix anatis TaxID=2683713 RepID=UPI00140C9F8C|nr:AAA family ATPase [Erysipelothrix anatis]
MNRKLTAVELLEFIDPSRLDYQEWVNVGMALHYEGHDASDFDSWSQRDGGRYKAGECYRKWESFGEGSGTVTGGTIYQYAIEQGWSPSPQSNQPVRTLDWDDEITDYTIIDTNWVEGKKIHEPTNFNPVREIKRYLETLFDPSEHVNYVIQTYDKDGKYIPGGEGYSSRTAGQLIDLLNKKNAVFEDVFGDYNHDAGAWIRFNPMDAKGVGNANVTSYKYALVESDVLDLEKQNAIIRDLELPVAALVYSGGKSLHAIVKIEASTESEYRKRVDFLYKICDRNGLKLDKSGRNASRLSRMPGVVRGDKKQFIIDTHIGQHSWSEWEEWIEDLNDDLPDPESLTDVWDDMPQLASPLIHNVLRQGHKMLIAGPSKAGKSFALIEMSIAIAEGKRWLNWQCEQGRVLYVNLELDRASALHRFKDVYNALGLPPTNIGNIEIWNLRGKTSPMDKLTPKLIRRSAKRKYTAVIIDPIYKVLTGDENSADQMAYFTNQFDKIATELGAAVIYCHHHSKGSQGGKKSMDRSSGSGVFARDPDALIDLVELDLDESAITSEINRELAKLYCSELKRLRPTFYSEKVGQDDELSHVQMRNYIGDSLTLEERNQVDKLAEEVEFKVKMKSAWRVEGTLREYPKFDPVNMWFEYPIHVVDNDGGLQDLEIEGTFGTYGQRDKGTKSLKKKGEVTRHKIKEAIDALLSLGDNPSAKEVSEYFADANGDTAKGGSIKSIKKYVDESEEYEMISVEGERAKRIAIVTE